MKKSTIYQDKEKEQKRDGRAVLKKSFFSRTCYKKQKSEATNGNLPETDTVEEFYFATINNTLIRSLLWKAKRLKFGLFEIEYSVDFQQDFIHSYVKLIEKTSENTKINMTFLIVDDKSVEKSCRINNIIFKSSLVQITD